MSIFLFLNICDRDVNLFLWKVTTLHICRAKCDYSLHDKYTTLWHALIFCSILLINFFFLLISNSFIWWTDLNYKAAN